MSRMRSLLLSSLLWILAVAAATPAQAVDPALGRITPAGVQRGTEVELQFSGARLGDTEQLLFYSPGFETKSIEKVNDNGVKAKVAVAAECPMGIHAIRLRTKTGVSNLLTFSVGPFAEVAEKEPNSEFESPQEVPLNSTISGVVQNEDVDYFVVEAKKGQRLVAELEGIRLGANTFFDPYMAILDTKRFELARSDDAELLRQDSLCSIVVPEDGKYIIQIRETAYGGNGNCTYRVHVGNFPRPAAVLPAGGRPGEKLTVRWLGDPAGEWTEEVTLPEKEDPEYGLYAKLESSIAPSPNVVRVVDLQNALEAEPNDSREQATAATAPGALNGAIEKPGDVDYFKFTAKKDQEFDVRVHARSPLRSPLDSVLYVQNASGGNVGGNDDSGGPDSYLRFKAPADGDYFVLIRDHLLAGGPTYTYRVEITPIAPAIVMGLPEKRRYVSTTLTVPRGNRAALMVSASRQNVGGEIQVQIPDLPAGLTMEAPVMPGNRNEVPVLFSAAADAATSGGLVDLQGKLIHDTLNLVGHLKQRTLLVRGQNNVDVYGHDADRMALSLAEEVPFSIQVVQPTVPIVRNGSMGLKVVATRVGEFKAPIAVRLLYNPPGIGSSGSIQIPEGQNEAVIPLTANGGAGIGKWPLIVTGTASHGGGSVEVASQMAELEISDSFFNFAFEKAAGELGTQSAVVVKVEQKAEFPDTAKVELLGLPANTSLVGDPLPLTKETTELVFPVQIAEDAKPNTYKSLVCRATIERNGETITHTIGTGELRVDKPLPPKNPTAQPAAKPEPEKQVAQAPPAKPLSRLEQLRLQREQAKAEDSGGE